MENKYQPSASKIPELNGLRVILVFIVSMYHIWLLSWLTPRIGSYSLDYLVRSGYIPVVGMLLLSSFLLFLPYARSMLLGEPVPSTRRFYERRIMRIVPSHYFAVFLMLFCVALPYGLYGSTGQMLQDVFSHLTFTHTFFQASFFNTKVGGTAWTLAIEMQAYLLFPLIARLAMKNTAGTTGFMLAIAWLFRSVCMWRLTDFRFVVNQLPNFLDVYAIGILAAVAYVKLTQLWKQVQKPLLWEAVATVFFALCFWAVIRFLYVEASDNSYIGQMMRRPIYALLMALLMISLPFTVMPLRFLMGNRVMGWLAAISFNYYLIHQNVAVHLRRLGIPQSVSPEPNVAGERSWQYLYVFLCFGISVVLATILTLLVEKPGAWALEKLFQKLHKKKDVVST